MQAHSCRSFSHGGLEVIIESLPNHVAVARAWKLLHELVKPVHGIITVWLAFLVLKLGPRSEP